MMAGEMTVAGEIEAHAAALEAAFARGDVDAVVGYYAEDAALLLPGSAPLRGREAVVRFWQGLWSLATALESRTLEVDGAGDLAYEMGTVTIRERSGGSHTAKYVLVWRRRGGVWLRTVHIHNNP